MTFLREPRRLLVIVISSVVVSLVLLLLGTWGWIERGRAELAVRFARERLEHVRSIARTVGGDVDDIRDDLRFAARLVGSSPERESRARVLSALLGSVRAYRAAAVFGRPGPPELLVTDPRHYAELAPPVVAAMEQTALAALAAVEDRIQTSLPLAASGDGDGTFRVFGLALPALGGSRGDRALVLLVDTSHIFESLGLIAADPQTRLLLLGPHGRASPISSAEILQALARRPLPDALHDLLTRMRRSETGTVQIRRTPAFGPSSDEADLVIAYAPIATTGGPPWSLATLTSMKALRSHERAIIWRLGVLATVAAVVLVAFTIYVALSVRQQSSLEIQLAHAKEVAHLHEKADKILESIPSGVLLLTSERQITSMNRALRSRFPHLSVGTPLRVALAPAGPAISERLYSLIDDACSAMETRSLHGERLTLFGEEGHYRLHAVPLAQGSPEAHALLVVEDLTEIRRLESQLLAAEKFTTIGVVAAGIAHEIGTPLGIVRGRAEYVLGKLGDGHPQAGGLRVIIEQIDRVTRTIKELLDFSRTKAVPVAVVELAPIAQKSIELLRYEAAR